jgi:hypothetical protein
MFSSSKVFDVNLLNIPILNLRNEFNKNYVFVSSLEFEMHLELSPVLVNTPYGNWLADEGILMTYTPDASKYAQS